MHDKDNGKPEPLYQELLSRPIRDLGLKLEGSPVERFVEQLYGELEAKGLTKFHPACYLTDEWGCPSGEPVIGIPFYLAHAALAQLEEETNDLEGAREGGKRVLRQLGRRAAVSALQQLLRLLMIR